MKKNFYKLLRKKIDQGDNPEIEKRFFENFRHEFGEEKNTEFPFWKALTSAAAMCAISFLIFRGSYFQNHDDEVYAAVILQHEMLLAEMDMFNELDDMDLSDDEWDVLLEETI